MWQVQGILNISTCPLFLRRKRLLWIETSKTSKTCQSTSVLFLEFYPYSFMTTVSQANSGLLKLEDHNMCHMKAAFNLTNTIQKPQEGISMLRCPWVKLQAKYASNASSIIVPSYQFLFVCSSISSPHTPCHYSTLWSLSPNIQYFGCRKQPDAIKSLELFTIFFFLICCVSSTWLVIVVHRWPNVLWTILKVCQITLPNKSK